LFDEIEKAHPDVFNMMLQVLDDGRLTDSLGHVVDFKNTILIMTSNLGTSLIGKRITPGFMQEGDDQTYEKMKDRVMEEMKRTFQKHIEDPPAEAIVRGQVPESARIDVDLVGGQFVFREAQAADAPLELAEH